MEQKQIEGTEEFYETDNYKLDSNGNRIRELFYNDDARKMFTKTMCFKAERIVLELDKEYSLEEISFALYKLMLTKDNNGLQKFVFDFYFKYIEFMISLQYEEEECLVRIDEIDIESKSVLFGNYVTKKVSLKKSEIGRLELERFEAKRDIQTEKIELKLGCSKETVIDIVKYVTLQMEYRTGDLYVIDDTGEVIGKAYINRKVDLYKLKGVKLIVKDYKETDKSYNFIINGIEKFDEKSI